MVLAANIDRNLTFTQYTLSPKVSISLKKNNESITTGYSTLGCKKIWKMIFLFISIFFSLPNLDKKKTEKYFYQHTTTKLRSFFG